MSAKNFGRLTFLLWLNNYEAAQIMEAVLDQYGKPIGDINKADDPYSISRNRFEKEDDDGQVCLVGYQGYKEHNPMIQAFAQQNAENLAQTLLFAPLTANTNFSRFNEWFPVLMQFLRQRDQVSREEVANFVSGIGGQKQNVPRGGLFASVLDRGEGNKTELISFLWNNRQDVYEKSMKMAEDREWEEMMKLYSSFPGVQPVKAGFMVQLAFGQIGCIDTHNTAMYRSIGKLMIRDPDVPDEEKEKWKELQALMPKGPSDEDGTIPRAWSAFGKNDKGGPEKIEKAVKAYMKVLDHMNDNMGITPRALWDFWVNYVAQRYDNKTDNQYSPDQGLSHAPDDEQLLGILGGKDRKWRRGNAGWADVVKPHQKSGGVSRVHLMAAITPADLLSQIDTQLGNKYHIVNAALRGDKDGAPALQTLSARILDQKRLQAIIDSGSRINPAMRHAKSQNDARLEQLKEQAEKALYWLMTKKYGLNRRDALELISIYTTTLERLYDKHIKEILGNLRTSATRAAKKDGSFVDDDEQMGFGVDTYDPKQPFDPRQYDPSASKDATKIGRLDKAVEPYISPLQAKINLRQEADKVERAAQRVIDRLNIQMAEPNATIRELTLGGKQSQIKRAKARYVKAREKWEETLATRNAARKQSAKENYQVARQEYEQLQKQLERAQAQVQAIQDKIDAQEAKIAKAQGAFGRSGDVVKKKAAAELQKKKDKNRRQLHGEIYD
jgi:hypothetical protein